MKYFIIIEREHVYSAGNDMSQSDIKKRKEHHRERTSYREIKLMGGEVYHPFQVIIRRHRGRRAKLFAIFIIVFVVPGLSDHNWISRFYFCSNGTISKESLEKL